MPGQGADFILRAVGSHGRVLSWSMTRLAMLPPVFPLWLLHGVWIEDRESGVEEPSAVKVKREKMKMNIGEAEEVEK